MKQYEGDRSFPVRRKEIKSALPKVSVSTKKSFYDSNETNFTYL